MRHTNDLPCKQGHFILIYDQIALGRSALRYDLLHDASQQQVN
jgi:hypothetical protein